MKKDSYNFDGRILKSNKDFFTYEYGNIRDIELILKYAVNEKTDLKKNNKGEYYYNLPVSFDIETSSFYRDLDGRIYNYEEKTKLHVKQQKELEKIGLMYIWQFGINGYVIIGRTFDELKELLNKIKNILHLNENKRIIIYVHNLSFEFQFLCKEFEFNNVFATDLRRVLYAEIDGYIFKCSYFLSGYNLDLVAKNLQKYKIKKLVGSLDYSLIRHTKTPLTSEEINYCVNDVKIVMLYIKEYIENVKLLNNIPLTKTGAVRQFCRKNCFFVKSETYKGKNYRYKNLLKSLLISDLNEFDLMQRAFSGGFTHANANFTNQVISNVSSFDFTSSYPSVMITEKYPLSSGKKIIIHDFTEFQKYRNKYLCIFDVEFTNIFSRETYDNYISVSKCYIKENFAENNGRLVCANRICLSITNVDYDIIENCYKWETIRIGNFYIYRKEYLPTEFVKCILTLYKNKTELKDVEGMEKEYLNSKEMLNSCYGMSVTNPLRNEFIFSRETLDMWNEKKLTENEKSKMLTDYNLNENRFLFYLWGVFVTAYARKNLWSAIFNIKYDYVYSDTDSIKFINLEKHKEYFETYNKLIKIKLQTACKHHNLDFELCEPTTKNGIKKMIGVWDFEGTYELFKTLGAKRYMIKENNALNIDGVKYNYSLTVSGVNKKYAIPYLLKEYGEKNIFKAFDNNLIIPSNATGKNLLTYIDYEIKGKLTDYLNNDCEFITKSGIHLEHTDYTLNMSVNYLNYILGLKTFKAY